MEALKDGTYEIKANGQGISLNALSISSRALWKPLKVNLSLEKNLLNREKEICSRLASFKVGQA